MITPLLPYPIYNLYSRLLQLIPCNQSSLFCSNFFNVINFSANILILFLVLFLLMALTQNLKLISSKKLLFLSIMIIIIIEIPGLIFRNLSLQLLTLDPHLSLLKLGLPTISINILNVFTYVFLTSAIIPLALYLMLRRLGLQKAFTISFFLFLFFIGVNLVYIPSIWILSEQNIQRGLLLETTGYKSATKFFSGLKHEIVNEEIINDSNNSKYKTLRINLKLIVPETYSSNFYIELRDKTGNHVAVQSYVNGKSLTTSSMVINLNKGENLIAFDVPFVYFNDFLKKEVSNLPSNALPTDTYAYTYGPFKLRFRLSAPNYWDYPSNILLNNDEFSKLSYEAPIYTTKNVYQYTDFYQR